MATTDNPDFSLPAKRLIVRTVQKVLGTPDNTPTVAQPSNVPTGITTMCARLTSQDSTDKAKFAWTQERRKADGTWEGVTGAYAGKVGTDEISPAIDPMADHSHGRDRSGDHVAMVRGQYKNGEGKIVPCWYICQTDQGPVYVKLTSDGGAAGSQTTATTWTYTAKSLDDAITYGTHITPKHQRRAKGKTTAATIGLIVWNWHTGAWDLVYSDEVAGTATCSTS